MNTILRAAAWPRRLSCGSNYLPWVSKPICPELQCFVACKRINIQIRTCIVRGMPELRRFKVSHWQYTWKTLVVQR